MNTQSTFLFPEKCVFSGQIRILPAVRLMIAAVTLFTLPAEPKFQRTVFLRLDISEHHQNEGTPQTQSQSLAEKAFQLKKNACFLFYSGGITWPDRQRLYRLIFISGTHLELSPDRPAEARENETQETPPCKVIRKSSTH